MDNSKKSELFTFGKLEKNEDSDSEDSPYDSADEDSVPEQGNEISSKSNENQQRLVKEMEGLTCTVPSNSSYVSSSGSYVPYRRQNLNGSDTVQLRPRYGVNTERRNLIGVYQSLRGNWSLRCDSLERNSDGLTEADIMWKDLNELLEKEPSTFFLKPEKFPSRYNFITMNFYTPDYKDEEFIQKVVNIFRKHIYFPYVVYYYISDVKSQSIYMHTPNGEFYRKKDDSRWEIVEGE